MNLCYFLFILSCVFSTPLLPTGKKIALDLLNEQLQEKKDDLKFRQKHLKEMQDKLFHPKPEYSEWYKDSLSDTIQETILIIDRLQKEEIPKINRDIKQEKNKMQRPMTKSAGQLRQRDESATAEHQSVAPYNDARYTHRDNDDDGDNPYGLPDVSTPRDDQNNEDPNYANDVDSPMLKSPPPLGPKKMRTYNPDELDGMIPVPPPFSSQAADDGSWQNDEEINNFDIQPAPNFNRYARQEEEAFARFNKDKRLQDATDRRNNSKTDTPNKKSDRK